MAILGNISIAILLPLLLPLLGSSILMSLY
ncbi:hypothetical protein ABVN80_12000 [Acinetobacter baumannii]